jgi:hypothetical protein
MRRREDIDVGILVSALGGVVLLVSLFLDWYEPGISGWTVFEALDLVLAAGGLIAIAALSGVIGIEPPRWLRGATLTAVAIGVLLVVASQAIHHPPAGVGSDAKVGQWLALAGAGLLVLGRGLSLSKVSITVHVEGRERAASAEPEAKPAEPDEPPTERLGPPD